MTSKEVFQKITSEHKWYANYCTKQYACILKKRFNEDKLSFDKLSEMFKFFGFELNSEWIEKKVEKS